MIPMEGEPAADDGSRAAGDGARRLSRRKLLGSLALAGTVAASGCVTLGPRVTAADTADSSVFDSVSVSEPWANGRVVATVKLRAGASTETGVRKLVTVAPDGTKFDTVDIDSGQTSATLYFPVGTSTLSAVDYGGRTVESIEVTVAGDPFP